MSKQYIFSAYIRAVGTKGWHRKAIELNQQEADWVVSCEDLSPARTAFLKAFVGGSGVDVYGVMVEEWPFDTPYIPTGAPQ